MVKKYYTFKITSYEQLGDELIIKQIDYIKSKLSLFDACGSYPFYSWKKEPIIKLLKKEGLISKNKRYKSFYFDQLDEEGKTFLIEDNYKNIPLFLIEEIEEIEEKEEE